MNGFVVILKVSVVNGVLLLVGCLFLVLFFKIFWICFICVGVGIYLIIVLSIVWIFLFLNVLLYVIGIILFVNVCWCKVVLILVLVSFLFFRYLFISFFEVLVVFLIKWECYFFVSLRSFVGIVL